MSHELHYLRICPQCRHENPEEEHRCQQCGLFIGMEPAVLIKSVETNEEIAISEGEQPVPTSDPMTDTWDAAPAFQVHPPGTTKIELECLGYPTILTVPSGATIGQQHYQEGADIPIPSEIAESRYLHRRHCRIDNEDGHWWITAIEQSAFGRKFTNPTRINDIPLPPGERKELHEGDLLRLSGLRMRVKRID